jgi:glycosyltransferase involved in cell wall biosynthesis
LIVGIDGRELERGKITGIGRYLLNFLKYVTSIRKDYRFIVYGNQFTHLDFQSSNLTIEIILERSTITWDQILLPAYLKRDEIEIFLSPYIKAPIFSPCQYITTIHDLLFLVAPDYTGSRYKLYNKVFKVFGKVVSKKARAIITDSEYSKKDIIEIFDVDEEKIHVIPLGVSEECRVVYDIHLIEGIKKSYGIKGRYIFYIGNFKPHKNVKRLIEAFCDIIRFNNAFSDIKLVLGGKRDKFIQPLERMAEKSGVSDRVIFTDFIKDEDLPYLYSGAEIFVYPSLYEGFGLPVLEAMACGTPVICSDTTSLPEVVGDSGMLIDTREAKNIASALITLLRDNKKREILKEKGITRAKEFTVKRYSSKILSLIETISSTG